MIWMVFEISINLFESWLMLYFMKRNMHFSKRAALADILCVCACTVFYSLFLFFDLPPIDMAVFLFPLLYSIFRAPDKWYVSLFWTINLAILFNSTAGLSNHIFNSFLPQSSNLLAVSGVHRFVFVIFANFILFVILFSASKLWHDYQQISWSAYLPFLSVSLCILMAEECIYHLQSSSSENSLIYTVGYIALLFCSWFSILLFHFLTESSYKEHQYESEMSIYLATWQHQQEFRRIYNDFVARQHDFKHALETLETLIAQNEPEEARAFLSEHKAQMKKSQLFVTGNTSVDALLTAKRLTMKSSGIAFKFTTCPLNVLPMPVPDFCSILGNILDNAIEAILRIDDDPSQHAISLTLARTYRVFHIICDNPCNPQTLRKSKDSWVSSKKSGPSHGFHGLGIPSIQKVVAQFDGHCKFSVHENVFHVELTIPLPEQLS